MIVTVSMIVPSWSSANTVGMLPTTSAICTVVSIIATCDISPVSGSIDVVQLYPSATPFSVNVDEDDCTTSLWNSSAPAVCSVTMNVPEYAASRLAACVCGPDQMLLRTMSSHHCC